MSNCSGQESRKRLGRSRYRKMATSKLFFTGKQAETEESTLPRIFNKGLNKQQHVLYTEDQRKKGERA
jgi:hypothetical protein